MNRENKSPLYVFSQLLIRVVPHMDQMDRVLPYLAELGALHQRHGVAKQHIDLLGLAFCAAIRGVVQVSIRGKLHFS